jgi:hypothetical protein
MTTMGNDKCPSDITKPKPTITFKAINGDVRDGLWPVGPNYYARNIHFTNPFKL